MDSNYIKGELLQVQTKHNEVFEGRFHSMTSDKSKISLYGVKELPKGDQSEGIRQYYNSEIHEINKVSDPDEVANKIKNHLKISQNEIEGIIKISKKYICINQVDNTFHEAIKDLNQYNYVAVSTDGALMGRKCKMPFLVLSTPDQIYIFDIQVMQYHAFDAGLKLLLESERPKKIVHDCRKISDCLYHKHNVKLTSIFDTQVGDLIITKNKKGHLPADVKTLQDCLQSYLGMPMSTIEEKLDLVQCNERPLSVNIKETLAKNIAYLHCLSNVIDEELKLPFQRGVECYVDNLRYCDDFKAWELCGKLKQAPKEFKNAIEY